MPRGLSWQHGSGFAQVIVMSGPNGAVVCVCVSMCVLQRIWPDCTAPYRQCLITAPRCYCITSHYPFFNVLTQVSSTIAYPFFNVLTQVSSTIAYPSINVLTQVSSTTLQHPILGNLVALPSTRRMGARCCWCPLLACPHWHSVCSPCI